MMISRTVLGLVCLLLLPASLGTLACGGDDDDAADAADDVSDDVSGDDVSGDLSDDAEDTSTEDDGFDDSTGDGEPPCGVVLDEVINDAEDAVADAGAVYFLEDDVLEDELRVHRIDRETGAVEHVATLDLDDVTVLRPQLAVDDAFVYVGADIGLWRVPVTGGEPEQLVADDIDDLAQDETHLYWSTAYPGGGDFDLQLRRLPKAGGDPEILFDDPPGSATMALNAVVAVDGTHVYWNDDLGDLQRMPKEGGEPEAFTDLLGFRAEMQDLVIEESGFYWFTSETLGGDKVYDYFHLEVDGSDRLIARVTGGFVSHRMVVHDGDLYFEHFDYEDSNGIYRVSVEGGDPDRLAYSLVDAFVPTEEGLYVVGTVGLQLLPVDGCER